MTWILLVVVICVGNIDCVENDGGISMHQLGFPMSDDYRDGRTLPSYSNKADESGIHLHIWNDMDNHDNYYPNLMKHILSENKKTEQHSPPQQADHSESIHINLNDFMPQAPSPQPPATSNNLLRNALLQTLALDEFRKSDQDLYGPKLNAERHKQSPFNWNYHPSAINYIPKSYDMNLNRGGPLPAPAIQSISKSAQRPSLYDQMHTPSNYVQDYYTNLHKSKPKSVIDAVGYEIGGLPKYSGRLLANEPMPQQYRTFKMFEPVPRQILMPPPTTRIPEFKPVPPRLKIIPVIDDYLEPPNPNPLPTPNTVAWKQITNTPAKIEEKPKPINYLLPVPTKQVQIIPFTVNEAITRSPIRKYIPKTELSYTTVAATESFMNAMINSDIERFKANEHFSSNQITMPSKLKAYLPAQPNTQPHRIIDTMTGPNSNNGYQNLPKLPITANEEPSHEYEYATQSNYMYNVGVDPSTKLVFNTDEYRTQYDNGAAATKAAEKPTHKKTNTLRKLYERNPNDIIKLNVTGFRNVTEDNRIGKNSEYSFDNFIQKKESYVKNGDQLSAATRVPAQNEYAMDSVSADTIQLSQTYSHTSSNVLHPELMAPTQPPQDNLLAQLANDVRKALLNSMGNQSNDYNNTYDNGQIDPFLITIFDDNDSTKYATDNGLSDDLQLAETDRRNSLRKVSANDTHKSWDEAVNSATKNKPKNHNYDNYQLDADILHRDKKMDLNNTLTDDKYYKWFSNYADEKKKLGRTIISEHFKKVEIEPNMDWVILPKNNDEMKKDRLRRTSKNETEPIESSLVNRIQNVTDGKVNTVK